MTNPTSRESQVAQAIIDVLHAGRADTWSLHGPPNDGVPSNGYLVSAPLMAFSRRGIPTQTEVEAWLELNRAELTHGDRSKWRDPVRLHYQTYAPDRHVPATTHRAAHTVPNPAELFFAGAWIDKAAGMAWLDVNIWYPVTDMLGNDNRDRAIHNGEGWGQHSIHDLGTRSNIKVNRRPVWSRIQGVWAVLRD